MMMVISLQIAPLQNDHLIGVRAALISTLPRTGALREPKGRPVDGNHSDTLLCCCCQRLQASPPGHASLLSIPVQEMSSLASLSKLHRAELPYEEAA